MPFVSFFHNLNNGSKRVGFAFWSFLDFYGKSQKEGFQKWPLGTVKPEEKYRKLHLCCSSRTSEKPIQMALNCQESQEKYINDMFQTSRNPYKKQSKMTRK